MGALAVANADGNLSFLKNRKIWLTIAITVLARFNVDAWLRQCVGPQAAFCTVLTFLAQGVTVALIVENSPFIARNHAGFLLPDDWNRSGGFKSGFIHWLPPNAQDAQCLG
ncbi:hypothetical protein EHI45_30600 [Rhizobium leguminosarum]|uniref:hypothetical protein n=1 Tax=Rhizobium leguminosarum TaxID=384 RepID=UPI000FEC2FE0|nr:hypothetical protein [Rhizobium leguminosarum]RWX05149.1 hypothetical protein EHI45_30600 [Rhizobium leguminosarum]